MKKRLGLSFFFLFIVSAFLFGAGICLSTKPNLYADTDFSWLIRDRNGRFMWLSLSQDQKYRLFVPLRDIPSELVKATILYEDRDFYSHCGVNFFSLARAVVTMMQGGRRLGASTLTMQLVRLAEREKTDTPLKKLWQIWRAFIYEYHYTKQEILEAYLNLAPYGSNVEGIGAASLVWFQKDVQALNLAENIALVTIPQNPNARSPLIHPNAVWDNARKRLFSLWQKEYPSPYNIFYADLPLKVYSSKELPFLCPHVTLEIYAETRKKEKNVFEGIKREKQEIITTLDMEIQSRLERLLSTYIDDKKNYGIHNGAMVLANWQTGELFSLVGSEDFFDNTIDGQIDGTNIPRSYGSTLKPFIYALALEQGLIHSKTILLDTEKSFAGYEPENADGLFKGPIYAETALKNSRNIPAVYLAGRLCSPDLYGFLQKAGIRLLQKKDYYGLALVLGGAEISLRDLAGLYAMLANGGFNRKLTYYAKESQGKTDIREYPLISPEASYITLKMLETQSIYPFSPVLASWKTGTSNGQRDALTVGIFGPYVLVVWIGNFDASSNPNFVGAKVALPLFFQAAEMLRQVTPKLDIPWFGNSNLNIKEIEVCASTGDTNLALCQDKAKTKAYFIPGISPIKDTGVLRRILVNKNTGFRECKAIDGVTQEEVYEFWSQELQRLFAKAGIYKKPIPPYSMACLQEQPFYSGKAPQIISPVNGTIYLQDTHLFQSIALKADVDADVLAVHWFVDNRYLGVTEKNESLDFIPKVGTHIIYAVDDLGRTSAQVLIVKKADF